MNKSDFESVYDINVSCVITVNISLQSQIQYLCSPYPAPPNVIGMIGRYIDSGVDRDRWSDSIVTR